MFTPVGATTAKFQGPTRAITTRQAPLDRARAILAQGKKIKSKEPRANMSPTKSGKLAGV